jgi:1-acyl-sn-glycerol-3-phosphate acyltransferase
MDKEKNLNMITGTYSKTADLVFSHYLDHLFRNHFAGMHLLSDLPEINSHAPLIMFPNHSTWWDGFLVHFLNRKLIRRRLHLMMLSSQLSRFPFFKKVGAYGISPESPKDINRVIDYTVGLLTPGNLVCIFPQGELLPWGHRPLQVKQGLRQIIARFAKPVQLLPLVIRAEFLSEQRPRVYFSFGGILSEQDDLSHVPEIMESLLIETEGKINAGANGRLIFKGKRSLSDRP